MVRFRSLAKVFPLEFLRFSNFITVVLGIGLGVTALNLLRWKKRALILAIIFSFLSIFFHLFKALDYEEAIFSLITFIILWISRKEYSVRSKPFDFKQTLLNIVLALVLTLVYGIVSFWFLDKKDFGQNFSLKSSIILTFKQISFNQTNLIPHTRYSRFFLDSLSWLMIIIAGFAFSSLFAPMIFMMLSNTQDYNQAKSLLEKYSISADDYFKLWPEKSYFFSDDRQAFIAYKVKSGVAVALGDPTGPESHINPIIKAYYDYCHQNGWRCCFIHVLQNFLPEYQKFEFKSFKIGEEAIVDLTQFTLEGKNAKKTRYIINSFEKKGFQTELVIPPYSQDFFNQLKTVSDSWLSLKGRHERTFALGYFDWQYLSSTPIFVVKDLLGNLLAFVNLIPVYLEGEASIDLMRHKKDAPSGIMDYLFIKLFENLKNQGKSKFSMGLAPLSGFRIDEKPSFTQKAVHQFAQSTKFLFSFAGLKNFKAKYANYWIPRYLIYHSTLDLPLVTKAFLDLSKYTTKK